MIKKFIVISLALLLGLFGMCSTNGHKTIKELDKMSPEELVREYAREASRHQGCPDYNGLIEARIKSNLKETLIAITKIFDDYDPTTTQGRRGDKRRDAYWAEALLFWVDYNYMRVRGTAEGRIALEADQRLLNKKKLAVSRNSNNDESDEHELRAEISSYKEMCSVNPIDIYIRRQLNEDYKVQLSDDELKRFSDFLVAKDPFYVTWSKRGYIGEYYKFLVMEPYYQAYLEFKQNEE